MAGTGHANHRAIESEMLLIPASSRGRRGTGSARASRGESPTHDHPGQCVDAGWGAHPDGGRQLRSAGRRRLRDRAGQLDRGPDRRVRSVHDAVSAKRQRDLRKPSRTPGGGRMAAPRSAHRTGLLRLRPQHHELPTATDVPRARLWVLRRCADAAHAPAGGGVDIEFVNSIRSSKNSVPAPCGLTESRRLCRLREPGSSPTRASGESR
jgi:hypothetical protein